MKTFIQLIGILYFSLLLTQQSEATQAKKKEKLILPKVALIALGPKPGRHYRMPNEEGEKSKGGEGSQAIMLGIPRYATPPLQVYYRKGTEKKKGRKKEKWAQLNIGFNNQVSFKKVPVMKRINLYKENQKNQDKKLFFALPPLEPNTHTLLLLTSTKKGAKPWRSSPKVTAIPLYWSENGDTKVLLINESLQSVLIRMGSKKVFKLRKNSKKWIVLPRTPDKKRLIFSAKGINDSRIGIRDTIPPVKGLLKVYVFYQASPKTNGGRTLGVFRAGYDKLQAEKK